MRFLFLAGFAAVLSFTIDAATLSELRLQTLGPDSAHFPGLLHYQPDSGGELQLSGRYRNLLDCTASQMGIRIHYSGKPFVRAQRDTQSGQIHGFFPANRTARRDSFAVLSAPLFHDRKLLLHRQEFRLGTGDPQSAYRFIGVMRGAQYEQALAETLDHPLSVVDSYEQLIRMLETGRVGAIVVSEMFVESTLSHLNPQTPLERVELQQAPMYAYFSQSFIDSHPAFLAQFNTALDYCRVLPAATPAATQQF